MVGFCVFHRAPAPCDGVCAFVLALCLRCACALCCIVSQTQNPPRGFEQSPPVAQPDGVRAPPYSHPIPLFTPNQQPEDSAKRDQVHEEVKKVLSAAFDQMRQAFTLEESFTGAEVPPTSQFPVLRSRARARSLAL
jgi:hypothetical protein